VTATFFQKFRGPYVKFIDSAVFGWIVTKFKVLFGKSWTANIFFREFKGSYVKSWTTNILSRKFRGRYARICRSLS
jgi:hypothetical protein